MYFSYFDESGDAGLEGSPSQVFSLSGVLVHEKDWLTTLDQLVSFRRYVKDQFGISPRIEVKANWLLQGKGSFKNSGLSFPARVNLYHAFMRFRRKCGTMRTFAVVINKESIPKRTMDVRFEAWKRAIERLDRFGAEVEHNLHILPDEGHGYFIQRLLRRMRRHHIVGSAYGTGTLKRAATRLIEDCSDRKSHEPYFVQLADLNAYAAYRWLYPRGVLDRTLWDGLEDVRITEVNRVRGGPPGIVSWP